MTNTPRTEQQLDNLETLAKNIPGGPWTVSDSRAELRGPHGNLLADLWDDRLGAYFAAMHDATPALVADLRRARDRVAELEAYAYGCDAEGCALPHSSWCDAAKKAAAENDGCTCGKPWAGHPQPHAAHCWTVNPPRAEVEEMRKRIAELTAENAKLIRWHREDEKALAEMRDTIEYRRAEQAARTAPEAPMEGETDGKTVAGRVGDVRADVAGGER